MYKIKKKFICLSLMLFICGWSSTVFAKKKKHKRKRRFRYDVIVINRKSESRKKTNRRPVVFTHLSHIKRDKCKTCHPKVFIHRKGANDINMQKNAEGKFCGKCHNGRRAWSLLKCDICHSGDPVADENAVKFAE